MTTVEKLKRDYQDTIRSMVKLEHMQKQHQIGVENYQRERFSLIRLYQDIRANLIAAGVGVLEIVAMEQEARDEK